MGLDFFRRSVELVGRYLEPGQRATSTIQTTGTKLDAEWATFLHQHEPCTCGSGRKWKHCHGEAAAYPSAQGKTA